MATLSPLQYGVEADEIERCLHDIVISEAGDSRSIHFDGPYLISPDHGSKLRLPHLSACRQVTPAAVAPVAVEAEAVERLGLPWSGGGSVAEKRHPLWGGSPTLSAMSAVLRLRETQVGS